MNLAELFEKKEPDLRKSARTARIMQQLRAKYPQAETDLEALLYDFQQQQRRDRTDIARLDIENDQEEADIDDLEQDVNRIQRSLPMDEDKKDACYHKVKSRYKVWPSAYASGALVQCRKKGAKNWGTKSQVNEGWRETLAALAAAGIMALAPGVSAADVAADSQQVPMIATIVIDGEVKKLDLTAKGFRDVREVEKFLDDFFGNRGMPWQGRIERGVPGSGQYQRLIVQ